MGVRIDSANRKFLLCTEHSAYGFGINAAGVPANLHWGARLEETGELPDVGEIMFSRGTHFNGWGRHSRYELSAHVPGDTRGLIYEPCLKVREPRELEGLHLRYNSCRQDSPEHLAIRLVDGTGNLAVTLHYRLSPELDLIHRWVEVENTGTEEIVFETLFSASWSLPRARNYRLTRLTGDWGREYIVNREAVQPGERVFESRTGISGHQYAPFFAVDEGNATEDAGIVRFGTLLWSGNWKFIAELDPYQEFRVSGGLNNFDFELILQPGETFSTPEFIGGYTEGGFGEMSRNIHRYQQTHLYPENMRGKVMPAIYNTYSSIRREQVTEENVLALVPQAAAVGIEMFIIDAGWQKNMGDWVIDPEKFPGGFKKVIDTVKEHGMEFGLWVEFERVDAKSKVYQEHPEWLIDDLSYSLLNFARRDVLEHVHGVLHGLLSEHDIKYLKMDLNRYMVFPQVADRRSMRTQYMLNFYELLERLRREFPGVFLENCAGGSGRLDLQMDQYFSRINRSDNQDTLDILDIHEGFTYLHPSKMAGGGCQISRSYSYFMNHREIPLRFMAHAACMSWLSLGIAVDKSSPEELAECAAYIALYKRIRHIVDLGELYRLAAYRETGRYAAFEFVLPDRSEALLFVFAHGLRYGEPLPEFRLRALDPAAVYDVARHGDHFDPDRDSFCCKPELECRPMSGRALMAHGIGVQLRGDLDSRILHFAKRSSR